MILQPQSTSQPLWKNLGSTPARDTGSKIATIEGVSAKPCQATIWVKKKIFAKGPESPHAVLNAIEKRGPASLSLVFASFSSYNVCKNTWLFLAMSLGVHLLNSKQADCL